MPGEMRLPGPEPDDRIHKMPPTKNRANVRSATPAGFAKAVFLSNGRIRPAQGHVTGEAGSRVPMQYRGLSQWL